MYYVMDYGGMKNEGTVGEGRKKGGEGRKRGGERAITQPLIGPTWSSTTAH
jgi:hypothetical protein